MFSVCVLSNLKMREFVKLRVTKGSPLKSSIILYKPSEKNKYIMVTVKLEDRR